MTFAPVTASTISGKMVPKKTVNAIVSSTALLSSIIASRENGLSNVPSSRIWGRRASRASRDAAVASPRKVTNSGPIHDCVNECTEARMPLRVRNVPKMVNRNATITRLRFQIRSRRRRSCTIDE